MLKLVAIQNFISFKNLEIATFQEGANFIIGQNGSGKSGFYELIRRCMYKGINHSWSSVSDENKPAIVLCEFDLGNQPYHKKQTGLHEEDHVLYTGLLYAKERYRCIYKIGLVYATEKDDIPIESYIDIYPISEDDFKEMNKEKKRIFKALKMTEEKRFDSYGKPLKIHSRLRGKRSNIKELFETMREIIDDIYTKVSKIEIKQKTSKVEHDSELSTSKDELSSKEEELAKESGLEQILWEVTKYYIQTFGYRGLTSIHWTRSLLMKPTERECNYRCSIEHAEILSVLHESDSVDHNDAKKYLDSLTYPKIFKFSKKGVTDVLEDDYESDLLKLPSGFFEANQLSLLLACKDLRTLCLEEPDRMMHPTMVERMRELLMELPEAEKKKVIIISSHNQMMINKGTVGRTHVFQRSGSTCSIRRLTGIQTSFPEAILRLPFSEYVLLVEGIYDQVFVKQLFAVLKKKHEQSLEKTAYANQEESQASDSGVTSEVEKDPKFYQFICCLHVAAMGGKESAVKVMNFLRIIGMENRAFYLFDRDMFFKPTKTSLNPKDITKRDDFRSYAKSGKFEKFAVLFDKENKMIKIHEIISGAQQENESRCKPDEETCSKSETETDPKTEKKTVKRKEASESSKESQFQSEEVVDFVLESKNIFCWKDGTIEDMIRASIVESVELETFDRILDVNKKFANGKMDDNVVRIMTKKLSSVDDMEVLARFVYESKEGKRFLGFIQKMRQKSSSH